MNAVIICHFDTLFLIRWTDLGSRKFFGQSGKDAVSYGHL